MAKRLPDAATVAGRWSSGIAGAGTKWQEGVSSVTVAPNAVAAQRADRYAAGCQNAVSSGRYVEANNAVPLSYWQQACKDKVSRFTAANPQGKMRFQSGIAKVLAHMGGVLQSLPERGDFSQNMARAAAYAQGMHNMRTGS